MLRMGSLNNMHIKVIQGYHTRVYKVQGPGSSFKLLSGPFLSEFINTNFDDIDDKIVDGIKDIEEPLCKDRVTALFTAVEDGHAEVSGNKH